MAQFYLLANLTKRQFIDLSLLGDSSRHAGLGKGMHGIALARMLAANPDPPLREGESQHLVHHGCWAGDRIAFTGDHMDASVEARLLGLEDDATENVYVNASNGAGWTDISLPVIAFLTLDDDLHEHFLRRATLDPDYLGVLWEAARLQPQGKLAYALRERFPKQGW